MFKRILVPLDGSPLAEAGLPVAASLARRAGGELRLVSVLEMPPIFAYPEFRSEDRERAEAYLAEQAKKVEGELGGLPGTRVREGHVAQEILEDAAEWDADLVVMGSHGRGGLSRIWIGSIADRCIRSGARPVLLLRGRTSEGPEAEPFAIRRITLPLDGSDLAAAAIEPAAALARAYKAPIDLIRVVSYLGVPELTPSSFSVEAHHTILAVETDEAEKYLRAVSTKLEDRGIRTTVDVVDSLRPALAIVERAGEDLVVMTTHGRGGLERSILGSVSDRVARGARGPVLIVPGGADEQPRDSAPR